MSDHHERRARLDLLRIYAPAVALVLLAFVVAYQFVDPAPPKRIVIATGSPDGAYARFAETYRAILHADGNGAGAFYIHVRQNGAPGYDIRTVSPKPLDRGYRIPLYRLPDGTRPPVQPDHAHAPSLGYVAYLLTGDRFYANV